MSLKNSMFVGLIAISSSAIAAPGIPINVTIEKADRNGHAIVENGKNGRSGFIYGENGGNGANGYGGMAGGNGGHGGYGALRGGNGGNGGDSHK